MRPRRLVTVLMDTFWRNRGGSQSRGDKLCVNAQLAVPQVVGRGGYSMLGLLCGLAIAHERSVLAMNRAPRVILFAVAVVLLVAGVRDVIS